MENKQNTNSCSNLTSCSASYDNALIIDTNNVGVDMCATAINPGEVKITDISTPSYWRDWLLYGCEADMCGVADAVKEYAETEEKPKRLINVKHKKIKLNFKN